MCFLFLYTRKSPSMQKKICMHLKINFHMYANKLSHARKSQREEDCFFALMKVDGLGVSLFLVQGSAFAIHPVQNGY